MDENSSSAFKIVSGKNAAAQQVPPMDFSARGGGKLSDKIVFSDKKTGAIYRYRWAPRQ